MNIPKDGYYMAYVQLDTGGTVPEYVHVNLGKPRNEWDEELLPEACSNFREVDTTLMVRVWPQNAAMELEALRTANAGLVEKVKRLEEAGDATAIHAGLPYLMPGGQEAVRRWKEAKGQP